MAFCHASADKNAFRPKLVKVRNGYVRSLRADMGQRTTLDRRKRIHAQGAAPLQEFDEKQAAFNANQEGQAVAKSNVDRRTQLKRFRDTKITQ